MALSTDLISKLVKVTNDKQATTREAIVYGTIVSTGGMKYVQLDGSDQLTPISSTTAVENGERVTVLIKDHTATVTGNLTSPSATVESVDKIAENIGSRDEDIEEIQNVFKAFQSEFEQTSESFQLILDGKVGEEDLRTYLRYENGMVEMGTSESVYKLQSSNTGVVILQDGQPMASMKRNTISSPVFNVGRTLQLDPHVIKVSASGHLIFN